ncbi:MAG: hypothetical protein PHV74_08650 [Dehalococcoidia bacterium]|nr:hypothetical protein [Dehalococcoidia bacterium]
MDEDGSCSDANQFSLMAYPTDTMGSAVLVTEAGTTTATGLTQTDEAGNHVDTNALYLKLATAFPSATYTGTITYAIVEGAGT